jgi:hypothetical protein
VSATTQSKVGHILDLTRDIVAPFPADGLARTATETFIADVPLDVGRPLFVILGLGLGFRVFGLGFVICRLPKKGGGGKR